MIQNLQDLLRTLTQLQNELPKVINGVEEDTLSVDKQIEFGGLFIQIGQAIQRRARGEWDTGARQGQ